MHPRHRTVLWAVFLTTVVWLLHSGLNASREPAFAFGVITDVQYADVDDGTGFGGRDRRFFRGSLETLAAAQRHWSQGKDTLSFAAQLGDLVDGRNVKLGSSASALERALGLLQHVPCRVLSLVGNHDLYNFDRETLAARLATRPDGHEFYSIAPAPGWRVVILDAYQESVLGWPEGDVRRRRAERWLAEHNSNDLSDGGAWFNGLTGTARRAVPFNGAFGREQLAWLRRTLRAARSADERVIILSHVVLSPLACDGTTMAWDYDAALAIIHERDGENEEARTPRPAAHKPAKPLVALVLCGHDHHGGYHRDDRGVHHLTLRSPLNTGAAGRAFGRIVVSADSLELRGPRLDDLLPLSDRWPLAERPPVTTSSSSSGGDGVEEVMRFPCG